jgi:Fur family transcriptional regulator, ferric uptake regulator
MSQLLSSRHLRVTGHRLAVLRELSQLKSPVSHPELTERLAPLGLDRATVYRNLLSLTDAGLIIKTQLGDNVWRFEVPKGHVREHSGHPHFVCIDCGDIACLPVGSVTLNPKGVRERVAEVQLRGQCQTCARS